MVKRGSLRTWIKAASFVLYIATLAVMLKKGPEALTMRNADALKEQMVQARSMPAKPLPSFTLKTLASIHHAKEERESFLTTNMLRHRGFKILHVFASW